LPLMWKPTARNFLTNNSPLTLGDNLGDDELVSSRNNQGGQADAENRSR
jgi:hypothetical protein